MKESRTRLVVSEDFFCSLSTLFSRVFELALLQLCMPAPSLELRQRAVDTLSCETFKTIKVILRCRRGYVIGNEKEAVHAF